MKPIRPPSMRWKLVIATVLIELGMFAILAWNGLRLIDETLQKQVELHQQEMAILLNAAIAPDLATQDYAPIADTLNQSRQRNGIHYFLLTDTRGKALLADGWNIDTPPPPSDAQIQIGGDANLFHSRIPIVISGQVYGQLYFGISIKHIAEARQHLIRQTLLIALIEVVLSIVLLSALAIWLTRHLSRLRQASEAVGKGNYGIELNIESGDEIGQLAKTFNRMTRQISQQLRALRDSESRFRSLLTLSTDAYWEQDSQFRFTERRSGRQGLEPAKVASWLFGKTRWELETTLTPEQWARHRATLEAHEVFRGLEYGVRFPDGSLHYFLTHGEPIFDADGKFAGYRGTASDITQRKLSEASLHLSASVFAEAHEGIIITDPARNIIDLNPMACELTGQGRSEALGSNLGRYFPHDEPGALNQAALDKLADKGHWRGEASGLRGPDQRFPILLTASAVKDQNGEISNYIFMFSDITAYKEQQAKLEALAHYDALTRLPNRVLLADRMTQGIHQARRSGNLLAVAYLDLDGFKPVNDTLGHDAGDQLLVEVAERLRNAVRRGDTVARMGGDEFALLLRADDFGECEAALLRVLDTLANEYTIKQQSIFISASIGVTLFPNDTADPDMLLRHADQAMYVAKQAGRNRYHFFDAELDSELRSKQTQLARIETAMAANEFTLFYQPKVDMSSGKVTGAEALIRWQHPERGLLPPAEFLHLVENCDLVIPLGEWVIASALSEMTNWRGQGIDIPVSVNVAARQLQAPGFVAHLRQLLTRYPTVPPQHLQLEIVETAALDDIQHVISVINECLQLGISFALDDFGTGYSSLTYFKRLPAQTLKIDRSFIRDMLSDPEDMAIVEGVIGLAHAFQREVIAEGVESVEHGLRLLQLGCRYGQGYGIARPMPAVELPNWIGCYRADAAWTNLDH
ncbi:MAG: EAL domain-containing protein [Rhodocyclales bacterium GT-UBC]|nr:MAG: EAL domain-containing protein [Rhodocyclales bacterium GT-UBC]